MIAFVRQLSLDNAFRRSRNTSSSMLNGQFDSQARSIAQSQQMNAIEVERKFRVSQKALENLHKLPTVSASIQLEDSYFCEELALNDRWLRQRNGAWELKIPVVHSQPKSSHTTVYRELVGALVWKELNRFTPEVGQLVPYAKLLTERKTMEYYWNERKVQIVLDICTAENGFRYDVGEIEILINHDSEIERANVILDQVAGHLGLQFEQYTDGKLLKYLKEKNETLYRKLADKGFI